MRVIEKVSMPSTLCVLPLPQPEILPLPQPEAGVSATRILRRFSTTKVEILNTDATCAKLGELGA